MTAGKKEIYHRTIQTVSDSLRCFQDMEIEDFILALQQRDLPRIREAIQKVPGVGQICDHTALLDVEPELTLPTKMKNT